MVLIVPLIIAVLLLMVLGSSLQLMRAQNAGEISFAVSSKTVNEGSMNRVPVSIPLQRTGGSQGVVTVFFTVQNTHKYIIISCNSYMHNK